MNTHEFPWMSEHNYDLHLSSSNIRAIFEAMDAHPSHPSLKNPPRVPPLALSLREFGELAGLSRGMVRKLIDRGEIPSFKAGRRRLVPYRKALAWAEREAA